MIASHGEFSIWSDADGETIKIIACNGGRVWERNDISNEHVPRHRATQSWLDIKEQFLVALRSEEPDRFSCELDLEGAQLKLVVKESHPARPRSILMNILLQECDDTPRAISRLFNLCSSTMTLQRQENNKLKTEKSSLVRTIDQLNGDLMNATFTKDSIQTEMLRKACLLLNSKAAEIRRLRAACRDLDEDKYEALACDPDMDPDKGNAPEEERELSNKDGSNDGTISADKADVAAAAKRGRGRPPAARVSSSSSSSSSSSVVPSSAPTGVAHSSDNYGSGFLEPVRRSHLLEAKDIEEFLSQEESQTNIIPAADVLSHAVAGAGIAGGGAGRRTVKRGAQIKSDRAPVKDAAGDGAGAGDGDGDGEGGKNASTAAAAAASIGRKRAAAEPAIKEESVLRPSAASKAASSSAPATAPAPASTSLLQSQGPVASSSGAQVGLTQTQTGVVKKKKKLFALAEPSDSDSD
jgi:DNA double-strand break repair and V(D)J recombination protein XRCC4